MARIRMLELDELAPDVRAKVEAREAAGLRLIPRIEAHVPGVADAQAQMARALAEHGGLSPCLFELVRLRIAFHNQCRTCMSIRYASAYDGTFDEDLVCSLEKPQESDDLSPAERLRSRSPTASRTTTWGSTIRVRRPARALRRAPDRRTRLCVRDVRRLRPAGRDLGRGREPAGRLPRAEWDLHAVGCRADHRRAPPHLRRSHRRGTDIALVE